MSHIRATSTRTKIEAMCRLGCMNAFGPACANEKSVQAHDNSAMNILLLESVTKNTVVLDNWETHIEQGEAGT